ncbi:MAG: tetratricopeptide repeat protein, partial [Candidatus Delongbacteria bacterium]|nr:tetratricopeptide repeat protein [Candidatus Delongbacteria bacterium]
MYEIYAENALGQTYYRTDRFEKSINCLNRSTKIANRYGYNFIEANSYIYLGRIYKSRKKNKKAIKCFSQSLEIFNRLNESRKDLSVSNSIKSIKKELKNLRI